MMNVLLSAYDLSSEIRTLFAFGGFESLHYTVFAIVITNNYGKYCEK